MVRIRNMEVGWLEALDWILQVDRTFRLRSLKTERRSSAEKLSSTLRTTQEKVGLEVLGGWGLVERVEDDETIFTGWLKRSLRGKRSWARFSERALTMALLSRYTTRERGLKGRPEMALDTSFWFANLSGISEMVAEVTRWVEERLEEVEVFEDTDAVELRRERGCTTVKPSRSGEVGGGVGAAGEVGGGTGARDESKTDLLLDLVVAAALVVFAVVCLAMDVLAMVVWALVDAVGAGTSCRGFVGERMVRPIS